MAKKTSGKTSKKTNVTASKKTGFSRALWIAGGAMSATLLLITATSLIKPNEKAVNSEPFNPLEGEHYTTIDKKPKVLTLLSKLGVKEGESFEIMSYTCPACKSIEPALDYLKMKKFQLGIDAFPIAQAEFFIKTFAPESFKTFRYRTFETMLSISKNEFQKREFLKSIVLDLGVTQKEIDESKAKANEYAKDTTKLADLLNVTSTPSVFIQGKYLITHGSHNSYKEYFITANKLKNLP